MVKNRTGQEKLAAWDRRVNRYGCLFFGGFAVFLALLFALAPGWEDFRFGAKLILVLLNQLFFSVA
ncbi:MAG: hypothetical protein P1V97_19405 [Planctomycetota bacterium]|nr:hypothetical protein [Planctomycetota bacterium]